jgi:acylphosphatase
MPILHKSILILGRVQGVGFRYSARSAANSIGIKGFVRNMPDGSVYIEAEGTTQQLDDFISWCHSGPGRAIVKHVDVYDGVVVDFREFVIK